MKNQLLIVFLLVLTMNLFAQEKTLVSGDMDNGGFGALVLKFTEINDKFGLMIGGRGGWIMDHKFVIGGGGYGLVNHMEYTNILEGELIPLMVGYGGLELEYINSSDNMFHFTIYLLLGAGSITYKDWDDWKWYDYPDNIKMTDTFWIASPALNLELNIASFFRLNAGVGYRFVTDVDLQGLTNSDIAGFEGILSFKFGSF